jgi:hypothetical protein
MSLRTFHIFFITICALLCFFVGGWTLYQAKTGSSGGFLWLGVVSAAGLIGLTFYLRWFLRHHGKDA